MLLRLAYLTATNTFAALRLLPMGDRNKDVETLALRHQITVLERQLGADRVKFAPENRAFLTALLAPPPRQALRRLRLPGQRQYILAVIEHANRRIRILDTTPHPTAGWVAQTIKNLMMDLQDASCRARYLIRDPRRDVPRPHRRNPRRRRHPDRPLRHSGPENERDHGEMGTVLPPRATRPHPDLERTPPTPRSAPVRAVLQHHRAHQAMTQAAPLRAVPTPITDRGRIAHLDIRRRDRLGGVLHEYQHAA
ncbi:hypothetical protein GCM10009827_081940 [Dactylosporangium maewongense]|uniref:Uncharacterized protein n=1 Tax=Dactylosporangium maewongense TaxID=634393 RepID=A0ABP4MUA0_9ACTN